jgi:hypothetical protein
MLYLTVYDDDHDHDNNNNNNNSNYYFHYFNGKYWAKVGTKLSGTPWIWISEGPVFIISGLKETFYCLLRNTFLQLKFKVECTV